MNWTGSRRGSACSGGPQWPRLYLTAPLVCGAVALVLALPVAAVAAPANKAVAKTDERKRKKKAAVQCASKDEIERLQKMVRDLQQKLGVTGT